jgi:hypothetical protein
MTVALQPTTITYAATAGQTTFPVPFGYVHAGDVAVWRDGVLQASGFSLVGSDVVLDVAATAGEAIRLDLAVVPQRLTDLPLAGPLRVDMLNEDLDRLTALAQQQQDRLDELPTLQGAVPTTVWSRSLLDDADAAAARATLGLGAAALLAVPVPVASGGTGATSAATARTALGAGQPATASLGANGYWRSVDTGVILQWGSVTGGSAVTFPLAFPTALAAVAATAIFGGVRVVTATSSSLTGFTCNCYDAAGASQTPTVRWIAVGY